MAVVHHPRNHPGYVMCICSHGLSEHAVEDFVRRPSRPFLVIDDLLEEIGATHQTREALNKRTLQDLLALVEDSSRPDFLAELKKFGVGMVMQRQLILNAILKAKKEGRMREA